MFGVQSNIRTNMLNNYKSRTNERKKIKIQCTSNERRPAPVLASKWKEEKINFIELTAYGDNAAIITRDCSAYELLEGRHTTM